MDGQDKRYDKEAGGGRIRRIDKMTDNRFLNLYDLTARRRDGETFHYYVASRRPMRELQCVTRENTPDGVMIYAVCREDPEKVVLIRQYRYPLGDYVYEMPAGLVDPGEDIARTAVREFWEETGMELTLCDEGDAALRRPFYTTVGLTDEAVSIVYGYASGRPDGRHREATEDMEVILADRREAKRILRTEKVAVKCAQSLVQFLHADPQDPFAFLEL